MVETWHGVSKAQIVVGVILRNVGKLGIEGTFGKVFLIECKGKEMNTPSALLVILVVVSEAAQIVIILLLSATLITLSAWHGKYVLTAMSGIGWVDESNRVYTHCYTGYRGF